MLKNYLKTGLRSLIRHKWVSTTNVLGLAVGIASAMLIFLFVGQQLDFDKNQPKEESIHRLETTSWVSLPAYLRETAINFPEVLNAVRFYFGEQPTLKHQERSLTLSNFAWVDSSLFSTFNFEVLSGDLSNALNFPHSIVLTESKAKGLFGSDHPIGRVISMDNDYSYVVTAVIKDVDNFHIEMDGMAAITDLIQRPENENLLKGSNSNFTIYLEVAPGTDLNILSQKIYTSAVEQNDFDEDPLLLRPFKKIYFAKNLQHERNTRHGNLGLVIVFALVGVLLLLVACINFINLTIAKTRIREKEVGVRKVMGATPVSIRFQFLVESGLIILAAFLIGMVIVYAALPSFNTLIGEKLEMNFNRDVILIAIGIFGFTGLCSAIYPALILSASQPVNVLRGFGVYSTKHSSLSRLLVTVQYAVSIFLIVATISVVKQLSFMQSKDLGVDHDYVMTFTMKGDKFEGYGPELVNNKRAFEQRLSSSPGINGITFLNQFPGNITSTNGMYVDVEENSKPMKMMNADPAAVPVLGIEILSGRNLSYDLQTDFGNKILINEEAVKQFNLIEPIGSVLKSWNGDNEVVGVIKNFHYNSLHSKIAPLAISWNSWTRSACVKLSAADLDVSIQNIQRIYGEFCPGFDFEYDFLDETFASQYKEESRLSSLLQIFAGITIFLSCMGLFTLTAFMAEKRAREIGIRKILGSTNSRIVLLLSNHFRGPIVLANLISWPVAYYLLTNWLNGFDYRTEIGLGVFILGTLIGVLIAGCAIGFQSYKATRRNPLYLLRME